MTAVDGISVGIYVFAAVPFALSLLFYATRSPWRDTRTGRSIFGLLLTIVVVLAVAIVSRLLGVNSPAAIVWRLVSLTVVGVVGWAFFANLRRLQSNPEEKP